MSDDWVQPGTSIEFDDTDGMLGGRRRRRPRTRGERRTSKRVSKSRTRRRLSSSLRKRPRVVPKKMRRKVMRKALSKPGRLVNSMTRKKIPKMRRVIKRRWTSKQRILAKRRRLALKKLGLNLARAAAKGVISKRRADRIFAQKKRVIERRVRNAKRMARKRSREAYRKIPLIKVRAMGRVNKKRAILIDKKIMATERAMRRIAVRKMNPKAKAMMMKGLRSRIRALDSAKKQSRILATRGKVFTLAQRGVLSKKRARRMDSAMKRALRIQRLRKARMSRKSEWVRGVEQKLYVQGKFMAAYKAAISHATSVGSSYALIPLGPYGKSGQQTIKMPLKIAKKKYEAMRIQKRLLEKRLAGRKPRNIPPAVIAITQKGTPVSPIMMRAQKKHLKRLVRAGKMHPKAAIQAIKQINKAEAIIQTSKKPQMLSKKDRKQQWRRPKIVIQVNIDPKALKYNAPGERVVTTRGGMPITRKALPRPAIPSAIPSVTKRTIARETKHMVPKTVKPTGPPRIVPHMVPAQTQARAKAVRGVRKAEIATVRLPMITKRDGGSYFTPSKQMDLNEFTKMFESPFTFGKRK